METIETLNQRLIDHFGIDTSTNQPIFRIVWADDQTEKRLVEYLDSGIKLLYPEVREVKKYSYLRGVHVLEQLVIIPEIDKDNLPTTKLSYEPLWTYQNDKGKALPPIWEPTKLIIDMVYAVRGKGNMAKYVEGDPTEEKNERIRKYQEELFGNETEVGDALAYKEGIVVPKTYEKGE